MVIALIILVNVVGGRDGGKQTPAEVSGSTVQPRADLPVLPVDVPPVTPAADAACPELMKALPPDLLGNPSRRVDSDSPFAYAWGEPPTVLVCGVDRPTGWVVGKSAIQINGVQFYVDTDDPDTTVWTAVDRSVYLEVRVPADVDSAPVTALTKQIAAALPYREPEPGP
ncbi:MAG: uncharacterized protein JWQ99_1059 [Blastococcus sp.]|nr:uncharacterized protein [Blastococcus sp.]